MLINNPSKLGLILLKLIVLKSILTANPIKLRNNPLNNSSKPIKMSTLSNLSSPRTRTKPKKSRICSAKSSIISTNNLKTPSINRLRNMNRSRSKNKKIKTNNLKLLNLNIKNKLQIPLVIDRKLPKPLLFNLKVIYRRTSKEKNPESNKSSSFMTTTAKLIKNYMKSIKKVIFLFIISRNLKYG